MSVETFANISSLGYLKLNFNKLRTVDINILRAFPELYLVFLHGNPLQCDCQLKEVWRWCEDRNIWTGDVICDTPREVEGMWWRVLEERQCLEGNIQYYGDYKKKVYSYDDIDDTYYDREIYTHNDTKKYTYGYSKYYDTFYSESVTEYQVELFAVPFIFGITSDVIILFIIICNKDMRTVPNMYIINLAISDIIYLTVLFSEIFVNRLSYTWVDGFFMCTFFPFCRRLAVGLSAYSIGLLSVQRYRVTVNPLHVRVSSQPT